MTTSKAAAPAVKLITDVKALDAAIVSIGKRGKKLDDDIQLAGLSCIAHTEKCGDIGPVNRLFLALPKGARKNAFAEWALMFGKYVLNEGATRKEMPFLFGKEKVTNMEGAQDKPWFECKPEQDVLTVVDIPGMVAALLKRIQKDQEKYPDAEVKGSHLVDALTTALAAGAPLVDTEQA